MGEPTPGRRQPALAVHLAESLGKRLRKARQDRELTLQAVAERVQISASQLSELERGRRRNPGLGLVHALCRFYEIPSLEMLFGDFPSTA